MSLETETTVSDRLDVHTMQPLELDVDSVSQAGSRGSYGSNASSKISSVMAARLKEEQKRAELEVEVSAMTETEELELAKLRLQMAEKRHKLRTKLAVSDAKSRILQRFETTNEDLNGSWHTQRSNNSMPKLSPYTSQVGSNVSQPRTSTENKNIPSFNPLAQPFVPFEDTPLMVPRKEDYNPPQHIRSPSPTSQISQYTASDYSYQPEDNISSIIHHLRKPIPEIKKFSGNPMEYRKFIRQFETKVVLHSNSDDEKLNYLEQFTEAEANRIVSGYSYLDGTAGYAAARRELEERYGNDDVIATAFVRRAMAWPQIKADKGLDDFAIFLGECANAVKSIDAVKVLQYPDNMKRLVSKLAYYFHDKWRSVAQQCRLNGQSPSFDKLVQFVRGEAKKANDPIFGKQALSGDYYPTQSVRPKIQQKSTRSKAVFATKSEDFNGSSSAPLGSQVSSEVTTTSNAQYKSRRTSAKPCVYCDNDSHAFPDCRKIVALENKDKIHYLRSKGFCFGCLRRGHQKKECTNKETCTICQGCHPTVLHMTDQEKRQIEVKPKSDDETSAKVFANFSQPVHSNTGAGDQVCTMAVVPENVRLKGKSKTVTTYAFLDPGSSISFCTEDLMRQLGAGGSRVKITLDTMAKPYTMSTYVVKGMEISSLDRDSETIALPGVYTKDTIPIDKMHIPTCQDLRSWEHLKDINIPRIDGEIGLLLGNNIPDAYTPEDIRTGPRNSPHAVKTLLGWIVWNLIRQSEINHTCNMAFPANRLDILAIEKLEEAKRLETLVRRSIDLDFSEKASDERKELSQEDMRFNDIMRSSMTLVEGHYEVKLPFRQPEVTMVNNEDQALGRLSSLRRKMLKNPQFCKDYCDFISKLLENKHAELVPEEELDRCDGKVWYIPHHGVYNPRKPGKIRVVFDCAARCQGVSLNDLLLQGPDMTNNLIAVLLRFRQGEVAIMGDIESMFHQVRLPKSDIDCFRFFWYPGDDLRSEPVAYRMLVHIFGAVSSPSVCNTALKRTAEDNKNDFSEVAYKTVINNFYVDDCLQSDDSEEQAIHLVKEVTSLCQRGGFRLTKWTSSSHKVLQAISQEERSKDIKSLDLQKDALPNERALGVHWAVEDDYLGFNIQLQDRPPTRRGMLSLTSSIYDPLGISAPVILIGKQLLQDLCKRKIGWDEEIPEADAKNWCKWLKELPRIQNLCLPRCYKPVDFGEVQSCELHLFSDASERGYSVATYLRLIGQDQIHTAFIMAKARVAPLKKITVPRLELTAAAVSAKLSLQITRELEYTIDKVTYWTDSMSVLRYLKSETGRFQTFVANRVTLIREISKPDQWQYISTDNNPADAASRGQAMDKFLSNSSWLHGPSFLQKPEAEWSESAPVSEVADDDPEVKRPVAMTVAKSSEPDVIERLLQHYSRWQKLKRAVGFVLLAKKNLMRWTLIRKRIDQEMSDKHPDHQSRALVADQKMKGLKERLMKDVSDQAKRLSLTVDQVNEAEKAILQHVQQKAFSEELKALSQPGDSRQLRKTNPILKLDPFISDGILRVGGRLRRSELPFESKYPILLPKQCQASQLIIDDTHRVLGHLGKNYMLSKLRERYWILGANSLIKTLVSSCITCRKYQASGGIQKMSDLPSDRITPDEPPFSKVGMDFLGPFDIKQGRNTVKRYGVVFTCLAIRAVHLEMAYSMDTDSCINAIRRFISRRGPVKLIRCDNGTNLVGSKRELAKEIRLWNEAHVQTYLQQKDVSWEFSPPAGSHFGGVWERVIRSVRKILFSLLQEQRCKLDDESLQTIFCEVEAILNGRPLTEMPSSPSDLKVLTPNDLLLHRSGEALPPGIFNKEDCYLTRRWRHIQYVAHIFWKRWTKEYLPMLQERQKWTQPRRNLAVGDLVLLIDSSPRSSWTLGRVQEVLPDSKGLVRMVRVRTASSVLLRPTAKLCLIMESDTFVD